VDERQRHGEPHEPVKALPPASKADLRARALEVASRAAKTVVASTPRRMSGAANCANRDRSKSNNSSTATVE